MGDRKTSRDYGRTPRGMFITVHERVLVSFGGGWEWDGEGAVTKTNSATNFMAKYNYLVRLPIFYDTL